MAAALQKRPCGGGLAGSLLRQLERARQGAQLVRQRRLAPVHIVAHSLGGTIGSLFAGAFPEALASLVVIEGVGLWAGHSCGRRTPPAH